MDVRMKRRGDETTVVAPNNRRTVFCAGHTKAGMVDGVSKRRSSHAAVAPSGRRTAKSRVRRNSALTMLRTTWWMSSAIFGLYSTCSSSETR